ncbi:MAG TPA: helix-turn-helix transcriptional regulator [Ktedonobacterales bacterium]|jgi:DNA-binding XRE family transcriptional regulator
MHNRKAEEAEEEEDFLEEMMREFTKEDPLFPEAVEAHLRKHELLEALAEKRIALGLSRAKVAKRLGMSASALESLERGESDPRLSLIMHLAFILGQTLELRPAPISQETPPSA